MQPHMKDLLEALVGEFPKLVHYKGDRITHIGYEGPVLVLVSVSMVTISNFTLAASQRERSTITTRLTTFAATRNRATWAI